MPCWLVATGRTGKRMASSLHGFLTGQLWVKLKEDVTGLRVFNSTDLAHIAYFHIRRYMLIQPGWACRSDLAEPGDLALLRDGVFQSLLRFDCLLKPGINNYFPAEQLDGRMQRLRRALNSLNKRGTGHGYLYGVFDTTDSWLFPTESQDTSRPDTSAWEKQSCFWVPINCREFSNHDGWRAKWEAEAAR